MKKIQRIVLDTNVFVSGIFWSGPPYQILRAWIEKKIELVISIEILEEYNRVFDILSKKYPPINLFPFIDLISQEAKFYEPIKISEQVSDDLDDDKFIACGLAARVNYIVSGDIDLLTVSGYQNLEIIKPRDFVNRYLISAH